MLFLPFLQEIISERLLFAAEILDRQHHSGKKNSEKTAGAALLVEKSEKIIGCIGGAQHQAATIVRMALIHKYVNQQNAINPTICYRYWALSYLTSSGANPANAGPCR